MIMATLPPARAGVGSAVNDTVREFGGASASPSSAASPPPATRRRCTASSTASPTSPPADRTMITNNVGAAIDTSRHLGAQGDQIAAAARTAFVDSMHSSLWIAAGLAVCAAIVTLTQLPRHGRIERGPNPSARPPRPRARRTPSPQRHTVRRSGIGVVNTDIVVIGGGAAGLTAALVLATARHRVTVVDDQTYRNATVDEFHGFPTRDATAPNRFRADAAARAQLVRRHVRRLDSDQRAGHRPDRVASNSMTELPSTHLRCCSPPACTTNSRRSTGSRERWGKSVFNCPFCDGWEHRDQPVVVIDAAPGADHLASSAPVVDTPCHRRRRRRSRRARRRRDHAQPRVLRDGAAIAPRPRS